MNKPMTKAEKKAAYDAWYLAEIDKGLEDIEAGRVVSNEEAKAHMSALFAQLEAENNENRKAA
jgi:predicted transcriptional regulator